MHHLRRTGLARVPLSRSAPVSCELRSVNRTVMMMRQECRRSVLTGPPGSHDSVAEERKEIASVDQLLKAIQKRADPALSSAVPRAPGLWSEFLLKSTTMSAAAGASGTSSSSSSDANLKEHWQSRSAPSEEDASAAAAAPPVTTRRMHDSYCELVLPFASNAEVLERYINAHGAIRLGKLLENLDSLAGSIAYKHMLGPTVKEVGKRDFYMVTASVERLDMHAYPDPKRDLRLSGQVIYTSRSSMEIVVKMESVGGVSGGKPVEDTTVMIGRFTMACRNAYVNKAKEIHQLEIVTDEEKALWELGEHTKARRRQIASRSLSHSPPSTEEAAALHAFYLKHGREEDGSKADRVWMGDTVLGQTNLMFPQERNVHQKIFGGYLMRLAYELGFTSAVFFCRGHVRFLSLDEISFTRPVPIGSILRLDSIIMHTSTTEAGGLLVHVGVKANVVNVATGEEQTTNDFKFTFSQEQPTTTRQVVPKTYQETMLWVEGRRALELGAQIRGSRGA